MGKIVYLLILLLFLFNLSYFSLKNIQVLSSKSQRGPGVAYQFIKENIPEGSRVIGDPTFYYAVTQAGSEYQYYDLYNDLAERERIQREVFKYEYMIVTELSLSRNPEISAHYLKNCELEEVARLVLPLPDLTAKINGLRVLSAMESPGYSCRLYKRKTEHKD